MMGEKASENDNKTKFFYGFEEKEYNKYFEKVLDNKIDGTTGIMLIAFKDIFDKINKVFLNYI